MNKGLDYRNFKRDQNGTLKFFSSKPKNSIQPKRAKGDGLTVREKQFAWNWYQNNSKRINEKSTSIKICRTFKNILKFKIV